MCGRQEQLKFVELQSIPKAAGEKGEASGGFGHLMQHALGRLPLRDVDRVENNARVL